MIIVANSYYNENLTNKTINGSDSDDYIINEEAERITIVAGKGDDTIESDHYEAVYIYAEGDGNDIINAQSNDTIKITSGNYTTTTSQSPLKTPLI